MLPNFQKAAISSDPFPHLRVANILAADSAEQILHWLQTEAPWALRVESFYEQHEFSLLTVNLPPEVSDLTSPDFINAVRQELRARFEIDGDLLLVDIGAHRLTPGQTIRIHNDYLEDKETHRLLIQINEGWDVGRGGLLMLFAGSVPEALKSVIVPTHASGFAFEISPNSHHAVSSVKSGERYTLVYTFRKPC
jgi:hypothetical protein